MQTYVPVVCARPRFFAPGSPKVQAINQSSTDPADFAQFVRRKFNRDLFNYESHWLVKATNARCLENTAACAQMDEQLINRRFSDLQRKKMSERNGARLDFNEWAEVLPPR